MELFNDKERSDSLVMYLRFLTSAYIKTNAVLYETFLEEGTNIERFCQTEVEPIDRDGDQVTLCLQRKFQTTLYNTRFRSMPW